MCDADVPVAPITRQCLPTPPPFFGIIVGG